MGSQALGLAKSLAIEVLVHGVVHAVSTLIDGNHLAANVSLWVPTLHAADNNDDRQAVSVASLADHNISLRFTLTDSAALYSYWFS